MGQNSLSSFRVLELPLLFCSQSTKKWSFMLPVICHLFFSPDLYLDLLFPLNLLSLSHSMWILLPLFSLSPWCGSCLERDLHFITFQSLYGPDCSNTLKPYFSAVLWHLSTNWILQYLLPALIGIVFGPPHLPVSSYWQFWDSPLFSAVRSLVDFLPYI